MAVPSVIRILTRLIREAPAFLKPGGWLAFETGAGQGDSMVKMLRNSHAFAESARSARRSKRRNTRRTGANGSCQRMKKLRHGSESPASCIQMAAIVGVAIRPAQKRLFQS